MDAHGGTLPADVHVLFANTGKEREETLRFVRDVQLNWSVLIHWLERDPSTAKPREVNFETASRHGEPFEALIQERKFLPNPVTRFCTTELKIRVMKEWMIAQGMEHWINVVGIRADEPRRVAKYKQRTHKERFDVALPLAVAGKSVFDVRHFWSRQPFDLQLQPWEGNCDLCYLKGVAKRQRIMRDTPALAEWWIAQEKAENQTQWAPQNNGRAWSFRRDVPNYQRLLELAQADQLFDESSDVSDLGDCACDLEAA